MLCYVKNGKQPSSRNLLKYPCAYLRLKFHYKVGKTFTVLWNRNFSIWFSENGCIHGKGEDHINSNLQKGFSNSNGKIEKRNININWSISSEINAVLNLNSN